jgi:hypothetical protein
MRTPPDDHHSWELRDARWYHESFAAKAALAREHPQALIMPGHDVEAWDASGIEVGL